MSTEALEEALRELHGHGEDGPADLAGERAAMEAYGEVFGASASKNAGARGLRGWTQVAAAVVALGVVVGACNVPASYDVKLGVRLEVEFDPADELPYEAIATYAKEELGATDINMAVHLFEPESGKLNLRLWGQDLPPDVVIDRLRADFPELEPLEMNFEVLEGKIDTNLGGKLMHQVFRPAIAEADLEVARERLLADLLAAGVEGEVDVQVREVDGHREIRVGVRREEEGPLPPHLLEELAGEHGRRVQIKRLEISAKDDATSAEFEKEVEIEASREPRP